MLLTYQLDEHPSSTETYTMTCSKPDRTKTKTGKCAAAILLIVSRDPMASQTPMQTVGSATALRALARDSPRKLHPMARRT